MGKVPTPADSPRPEQVGLTEHDLSRIAQDEIRNSMVLSDSIYVELRLTRDLYIGALLSYLLDDTQALANDTRHELYNHIIAALPTYRQRQFNDTAHYFPKFKLINRQITARLQDPKYADMIFRAAPVTDFVKLFRTQMLVNVNHSMVLGKHDPIYVTVNTYPLRLSKANEAIIGLFFANEYGVSTRVICLDPNTLTVETFSHFDEIYTYDFNAFLSQPSIKTNFEAMNFLRKRFFMPAYFGDTIDPKRDVAKEERLVKSYMNILTIFNFIPLPFVTASIPGQEQRVEAELNRITKEFNENRSRDG